MDFFRNGTRVPQFGYLPNCTMKIYNHAYFTFQEQLGFDKGDRCVDISPAEWADGFNLYSFKITDGPIGSGTVGPRSHSETGSARLEVYFETAPQGNFKLIIMYQMLGIFEIDRWKKNRRVLNSSTLHKSNQFSWLSTTLRHEGAMARHLRTIPNTFIQELQTTVRAGGEY